MHEHLSTVHLGVCTFPNHNIATHSSRCRKIATYRSKIKRSNCKYKTFERPVLHPVIHPGSTDGLLPVNITQKMNIKPKKVYQFTGTINFCLHNTFALTKHGSSIDVRPVFCSQK